MTPNETAIALVEKYKSITLSSFLSDKHEHEAAKACSIIAVDEIMEENKTLATNYVDDFRLLYWQEVKKQIELL